MCLEEFTIQISRENLNLNLISDLEIRDSNLGSGSNFSIEIKKGSVALKLPV